MNLLNRRGFLLLNGLAPRDRRALLIGLGILLPVGAYVLGVKPYRAALEDVRDRVQAERELLARELELLEAGPGMPERMREVQAEAEVHEERLVRAASGVLAEAALTGLLEASALQSRVLLEEIRGGELGRGESPPPGLAVVRLHLRGESDLEGVMNFLDRLEKSPLLLRIRGLALEPETARAESDDDGERGPSLPTGVVEFQMIVDGFARVEEYGS